MFAALFGPNKRKILYDCSCFLGKLRRGIYRLSLNSDTMECEMDGCVSVIIPTRNGGELFRKSLAMIFSQEIDFQMEVIVIDSESTDQTLDICLDYPVKLLKTEAASFSHSTTRNLAIEAAAGDICVLTVQDAVPVNREWLKNLVAPVMQDEKVAGVFGQQVIRPDAHLLSRYCRQLWYREWQEDWEQGYEQLPVAGDKWETLSFEQKMQCARFDNVTSCIRRSVWKTIAFPAVPYAEDVAWARAVLLSGFSIVWQPEARVYHSHNRSLAYEFKRSYVDSKTLSALFENTLPLLPSHLVGTLLDWLAGEACRYLRQLSGGAAAKTSGLMAVSEADRLWRKMGESMVTLPRGKGAEGTGIMMRKQIYGHLSRLKWLKKIYRLLLSAVERTSGRKKDGAASMDAFFLLELQGRHHFFSRQLQDLYSAENDVHREGAAFIRFGAAVMVAGSMLGQYMSELPAVVKKNEGCRGNNPGGDVSPGCGDLWQILNAWQLQTHENETAALMDLERLLTSGV